MHEILEKNVKISFGDIMAVDFYLKAVNIYSIDEFNAHMNILSLHNLSLQQVIVDMVPNSMVNSKFITAKFEKITNYPAKSINSGLKIVVCGDINILNISIKKY